jgi:Ca2+/Na+ antiporter
MRDCDLRDVTYSLLLFFSSIFESEFSTKKNQNERVFKSSLFSLRPKEVLYLCLCFVYLWYSFSRSSLSFVSGTIFLFFFFFVFFVFFVARGARRERERQRERERERERENSIFRNFSSFPGEEIKNEERDFSDAYFCFLRASVW